MNNDTVKKRKEYERKSRLERIITIARRLFYEKGYENVSLSEIAKHTGYSPMGLYKNIKSKEELFLRVILSYHDEKLSYEKERCDKVNIGYEKLITYCWANYDYYRENRNYLNLVRLSDYNNIRFYNTPDGLFEDMYKKNKKAVEIFSSIIDKGVEDKSIVLPDYFEFDIFLFDFFKGLRTSIAHSLIQGTDEGLPQEEIENEQKRWFNGFINNLIRPLKGE